MAISIEKNGITKPVNPIGLKKFATLLDNPQKVLVEIVPNKSTKIELHSLLDKEKTTIIPNNYETTIKVGTTSGRIIEASSGSTAQLIAAINSDDFKNKVYQYSGKNERTILNADASIALINKVLK